jgi:hypothetical protein
MADAAKKAFEAKLDADPRDEMSSAAKKFLNAKENKKLSNALKKFIYSEKVELDPRKWNKKDLESSTYAVARYEIKLFVARVEEMIKAGKADSSAIAEIEKLQKKAQKDIDKKLSLAVEELVSDKGDNKKSLKDCKGAFDKLARVDFSDIYSIPRVLLQNVFEDLAADIDGADEKEKSKILAKATKEFGLAVDEFEKTGKAAESAIDTLLKAANSTKANKSVDKELGDFADLVVKQDKKISEVLGNIKTFAGAISNAEKALKAGNLDRKLANVHAETFSKMSKLDGSAKGTLKEVLKLEKDFNKIAKKLK